MNGPKSLSQSSEDRCSRAPGRRPRAAAARHLAQEGEDVHRRMSLVGARDDDTPVAAGLQVDVALRYSQLSYISGNDRRRLHAAHGLGVDRADLAAVRDDVGVADDRGVLAGDDLDRSATPASRARPTVSSRISSSEA